MLPTTLLVNGYKVSADNLDVWRSAQSGITADIADFLEEWFNDDANIILHTSGSTGKPQNIPAPKTAMVASALRSCEIFDLKQGSNILLCLPMAYIAGKMMVVRAMVSGANLLTSEPSSTPLEQISEHIHFVSLVPMQATKTLAQEGGREALASVDRVLLGGGFIDENLEKALQKLPNRIYSSYGMTETFSHIALRRINGEKRSYRYTPLQGVSLSLSEEGTLRITAPHLDVADLETNDQADLAEDGSFLILGRRDAVINSGGIKIQAEEPENALQNAVNGITVVALPAPHPELGECVAILWDGDSELSAQVKNAAAQLPKHHRPHYLLRTSIPRTISGKPARAECQELLQTLLQEEEPEPVQTGFKKRIIRSIEDLQQSQWWEKAKDPKIQATIYDTAQAWLKKMKPNSRIAQRLQQALELFRNGKNKKGLLTPRNIIILTAVLLYTVSPMDGIPDILPIIGLLDDLGLITLALAAILKTTNKDND